MPRRRRRPYDPLAPLAPPGQRRLALRTILPAIAALNAEFDRQSRAGQAAIHGYTDEAAGQLGAVAGTTHAAYAPAIAQQEADDRALADRLAGLGLPEAGGASVATAGLGSAALGSLRGRAGAAEAFSGQLPGLARLAGVHHAGQFGAQIESERSKETAALRGQIPSIVQHIADQQMQAAIANVGLGAKTAAIAETARGHTLAYKSRMAAITAANQRTGMTLAERARHNAITEAEQAKRDTAAANARRQALKQQRRNQWYREQVGNWKRTHPSAGGGALAAFEAAMKAAMKKH